MIDIIIHCSDSGFGNAVMIDNWHRQKGWSMIGYHFVILNGQLTSVKHNSLFDGHIETGRPLDEDNLIQPDEVGAHTLGYNTQSVGICLIGLSGKFSIAQLRALKWLVGHIKAQFIDVNICQHSDKDPVNRPFCAGLTYAEIQTIKS